MIADPLFLGALVVGPAVYWSLPARWRAAFLVLLSVGVLGWRAPGATAAVVGWTVLFAWALPRAGTSLPRRMGTGLVLAALGWLAAFKYVPVLIDAVATHELEARIILPIGISYWVFKLVHYAVEVGRGRIAPHGVFDVLAWTTLFPAFTAGPIERFDHFLAHRAERPDAELLAEGVTRILHGLVKKLLLADTILLGLTGDVAPMLARLDDVSTPATWAWLFAMYLWAYLDFSAYSDIAIGASRLFGIRLAENFDWPILARNLSEFWKRWHMSLAAWCQAYVYMPSVGLTRSPYLATYATFLVMGAWHGAALNWLCWGLFHGTGVAVHLTWTRWARKRPWHRALEQSRFRWVGWVPTTAFVTAAAAFTTTSHLGGLAGLRLFGKLFLLG